MSPETLSLLQRILDNKGEMMLKKILIIDDNEMTLTLVTRILELDSHQVVTARDATEALTHLKENLPDLVIMDVMMPDMNGYDLCRQIRLEPRLASIPILIMTAEGSDFDKQKALDSGANDLLTKPFNIDALRQRIKDLMIV